MHERGRSSAASSAPTTSVFAARIEMPVVLRGGMLDGRPALVPAALTDAAPAHLPRRFGTAGWIAATALCALSVYAVRDTMFAPLAQSEAPSSAWEARVRPGDTNPPLIAAPGTVHVSLGDHDHDTDASATGTTVAEVDPGRPSTAGSMVSANGTGGGASTAATPPSAPGDGATTASTADPTTSSSPSTSTPDTLGGHGANSGNGKDGSGTGSGSP